MQLYELIKTTGNRQTIELRDAFTDELIRVDDTEEIRKAMRYIKRNDTLPNYEVYKTAAKANSIQIWIIKSVQETEQLIKP